MEEKKENVVPKNDGEEDIKAEKQEVTETAMDGCKLVKKPIKVSGHYRYMRSGRRAHVSSHRRIVTKKVCPPKPKKRRKPTRRWFL